MTLAGLFRWIAFLLVALLPFPWRAWTDSPSPLSVDDFAKMFESIPGTGNGSCLRTWKPSPYPTQKTGLSISLQALADAKDMSNTVTTRLSDYLKQHTDSRQDKALRLLLFLFFGITFRADFYPNYPESVRLQYVLSHFEGVIALFEGEEKPLPRWFCSDDWLRPTRYLIGPDGEEEKGGELAAVHYNRRYYNQTLREYQFFPILLWDQVRNSGYYDPDARGPNVNWCGRPKSARALTYKNPPLSVTLCPAAFALPTTSSLGEPGTHGNFPDSKAEFDLYYKTISMIAHHELLHVAYPGVVTDQPRAIPANNDWTTVGYSLTDFSTWTTTRASKAYGLLRSTWLGLAKPELAKNNADSYPIFALCVKYPVLDCVGKFTYAIAKRQSVPFAVSPRVAKKLRNVDSGFGGQLNESVLYAEDNTDGERFTPYSS